MRQGRNFHPYYMMTQIGTYLWHNDEENGRRILEESYESQLQEYEKVNGDESARSVSVHARIRVVRAYLCECCAAQLVQGMCPRGVDDPECPKILLLWFSKCPMTGCYGEGAFREFPHLIDGQFLLDLMKRTKCPVIPALWTSEENMAS